MCWCYHRVTKHFDSWLWHSWIKYSVTITKRLSKRQGVYNGGKIQLRSCKRITLKYSSLTYINFPKWNLFFCSFSLKVSYVAAGFYRASLSFRGPNLSVTRKWLKDAWNYYNNLKNSVPQQDTGREYKECALLRALLSKFPFYYESVAYILTS